jgi:RimJ/RimL family protein N-acetyltransferase
MDPSDGVQGYQGKTPSLFSRGQLGLRAFEPTDLEFLAAMASDLEARMAADPLPPWPSSQSELEDRLHHRHPAPLSGAARSMEFALCECQKCIGVAGAYDLDRASGVVEIGISIGDDTSRGRGVGLEAHRLLIDYLFRVQNFRRITGSVKASNDRALAISRRLLVEEGRRRQHRWIDGRYEDLILFGLLRSEWDARADTTGES